MNNEDTIKLLRECNAGIKMGVTSIDDVLDKVSSSQLEKLLNENKNKHTQLGDKTHVLLNNYNDDEKDPHPMAKAMSWIKTNITVTMNESDKKIADIIYEGCSMGIKSLNKYMNEYSDANEESKQLVKETIKLEEQLRDSLASYL